jgi:hypothetical protein
VSELSEDEVKNLVAERNAETRRMLFEEIEQLQEEIGELREENERLLERVGLSESRENAIPEDVPQLMRYADLPVRDREARLSANQQRAVDVWTVWDVYADCGGEIETLRISEIRKFLRSRNGGDGITYQTAKRTAEFMVRLSEGLLEMDHSPDGDKRLARVMSVDEWRVEHYREKKEERERRKAERTVEAREEVEQTLGKMEEGSAD